MPAPTPAPKRTPVVLQMTHPVVVRGIVHLTFDVSAIPGKPRVFMEEEQRGVAVTVRSRTPGAPDVKLFVPMTNIAAITYGEPPAAD